MSDSDPYYDTPFYEDGQTYLNYAKYLKVDELKPRTVYRILSRNLTVGVWNPENKGFIGIREKFGDRYLFEEYHWDTNGNFGTVRPVEPIAQLSERIIVSSHYRFKRCYICGAPAVSEKLEGATKFSRRHTSDEQEEICGTPDIRAEMNGPLFHFLHDLEVKKGYYDPVKDLERKLEWEKRRG